MTVLDELDTAVVELDANNRVCLLNAAAAQCLALRHERREEATLDGIANLPEDIRAAVEKTRRDQRTRRLMECRLADGHYDCRVRLLDGGRVLLEFHDLEWSSQKQMLDRREIQTGLLDLMRRNLGHEIRNPLGGIRGAAQMLSAELEDPDLGSLASLIMREVDRIDDLIQRFWQPRRSDTVLDVHRALEEALEVLSTDLDEKCEVIRDYDPSIPNLRGDALAMRRLFLNLLRNAGQAGASRVRVRTRIEHGSALLRDAPGAALRVDIEDDGEGVPEALRPLLFLPMVTGRRDGTGLGLALAQQVAASHDGLLTYEALSEGSRFSLRLPVAEASKAAAGA